jgi:hypothetical protein
MSEMVIPMPDTSTNTNDDENSRAYTLASLLMFDFLTEAQKTSQEYHDPLEDFNSYASGEIDTDSFKGQYVAIWKKQVAGNGRTALEAELLAKARFGSDAKPAVVYVAEDENAIL